MTSNFNINSFVLLEKIGEGSFSDVYKIREKSTDSIFAVKILNRICDLESKEFRVLKTEIDAMVKSNHPSVIKFIGFSPFNFRMERYPMIITEYLPNGSLLNIMNLERSSNSPPVWDSTKKLINIYGIASAMSCLHANNIIHRDLKPDNILMDEYLYPKVADFGLAKITDSNVQTTVAYKGTPQYIAPEVWRTYNYTNSCDVYSYSLILYEIMTTQKPFENAIIPEILACSIDRKRFLQHFPEITNIPESYRKLIEQCWSSNPRERPTFDEILTILETDEGFIIPNLVDKDEYQNYIDYIKETQAKSKDSISNSISISEYMRKKSRTFSKVNIIFDKTTLNKPSVKVIEEEAESSTKDYNEDDDYDEADSIAISIKRSAENGNIASMVKYGEILLKGEGLTQNKKEAVKYFKKAADEGDLEGLTNYAICLLNGDGLKKNRKKSIELLKEASNRGSMKATHKYADILYEDGQKKEAIEIFKETADQGDLEGKFRYAVYLYKGEDSLLPQNKEESCRYFKEAADQGHVKSMVNYASLLYKGDGIKIDRPESFRIFKKAADLGDAEAMNNLGILYMNGFDEIIPKNMKEAAVYFKKSAELGNSKGMNNFANCLFGGKGVFVDKQEAYKYYKMAADLGNYDSMNNLANMLMDGDGVELNESLAFKYLGVAADAGHPLAAYNYALLLEKGEMAQIDLEVIKNYFKIAADGNNKHAAFRYATYLNEEGNLKEADKYLKLAADMGHPEAAYFHGKNVFFGNDCDEDQIEGLKYINDIAQKNGSKRADLFLAFLDIYNSCSIC